jgi:CRP-like cAMP-binding protein
MENPLVLALQRRDALSSEEEQVIGSLCRVTRDMPAKRDLVVHGVSPEYSTLLLSGLAARYNIVGNGSRQISAIHFPGDFVDLHILLLAPMDHSVLALSDCRFAAVPHQSLREVSASHAQLTRLLWMLTGSMPRSSANG